MENPCAPTHEPNCLGRHHLLCASWQEYPLAFGVLLAHEQQLVHRYCQTKSAGSDVALLAMRRQLATDSPAGPHVASEVYHYLLDCFEIADQVGR